MNQKTSELIARLKQAGQPRDDEETRKIYKGIKRQQLSRFFPYYTEETRTNLLDVQVGHCYAAEIIYSDVVATTHLQVVGRIDANRFEVLMMTPSSILADKRFPVRIRQTREVVDLRTLYQWRARRIA